MNLAAKTAWGQYVESNTEKYLTDKASRFFYKNQLPNNIIDWKQQRVKLIRKIEKQAGISDFSNIPLNLKVHSHIQLDGYSVENITFQVRSEVYATANLFIPDGKKTFPAVLNLHGHTATGRFDPDVQYRSHMLAKNGFICLSIDTWGSGERTTQHGVFEYHGGNLGANLLNIGETLLGGQIMDNKRAIDLLVSLKNVDKTNIAVTGESGGGNQTMWIMALDERIKAAIPVVSVGTFEAYALGHNCVCELLPEGMTFMEESAVISLAAPRYVRIFSAKREANTAFMPSEMLRTYNSAKTIFEGYHTANNLSYQLFDATHSYNTEMADSMIVWFSKILKHESNPAIKMLTAPIDSKIVEKLWVFPKGERPENVKSIADYCISKCLQLKKAPVHIPSKTALRSTILSKKSLVTNKINLQKQKVWQNLQLTDKHSIPIYLSINGLPKEIVLDFIDTSNPTKIAESNTVHLWVDLFGKGQQSSALLNRYDNDVAELHTVSRSILWLGESSIGFWDKEIRTVIGAIRKSYPALPIKINAENELGIAAIISSVFDSSIRKIETKGTPLSYQFDKTNIGFDKGFMGAHIPSFLKWGDVSHLVALSKADIDFKDSKSFSGRKLDSIEIVNHFKEFQKIKKVTHNTQSLRIR